MISMFDVSLIKEETGENQLIYCNISGRDFLFKKISLQEYVQCKMLTSNDFDFNDYVCQICLLHSSDADFQFSTSPIASISDICAPYIIEQSYIHDIAKVVDLLEEERDNNNKFSEQCALIIKSAFPEFPLDDILSWHYSKMMKYVARAEFILTLKLDREIKLECDIKENAGDEIKYSDKELLAQGVDLVMYYGKDLSYTNEIIDRPIIIGKQWKNEEVISGVRQQIRKR